jgi:hypothetical protein
METLGSLLEMALTFAVVAAVPIGIAWGLAGRDGYTLAELFRIPSDPTWPRGIQEDEPVRLRFEHIDRRSDATLARAHRPLPGCRARLSTEPGQ